MAARRDHGTRSRRSFSVREEGAPIDTGEEEVTSFEESEDEEVEETRTNNGGAPRGWELLEIRAALLQAFRRLPFAVRSCAILILLMIAYITALWAQDFARRRQEEHFRLQWSLSPSRLWQFDTAASYHFTPYRLDFCAYYPLVQSSLLPALRIPAGSDDNGDGDNAHSNPLTLHHLGHQILGYGTVRLDLSGSSHRDYYHPPTTWVAEDYPTVLLNVLHVPAAQEPSMSVARLLTETRNDTKDFGRVLSFLPDGTLNFQDPKVLAWISGGRYVVRAWAWMKENCPECRRISKRCIRPLGQPKCESCQKLGLDCQPSRSGPAQIELYFDQEWLRTYDASSSSSSGSRGHATPLRMNTSSIMGSTSGGQASSRTAQSSLSPFSPSYRTPSTPASSSSPDQSQRQKDEGKKEASSAWERLADFTGDQLRWRQ